MSEIKGNRTTKPILADLCDVEECSTLSAKIVGYTEKIKQYMKGKIKWEDMISL